MKRLLVTLAAAALLASGCGGSKDEAGSVSEPTVSAATTGETESQPGSVETVNEKVTDTVREETDADDSGAPWQIWSSHSRPCRFAGRPSGARPGAGRPYRVACRTTSWFESTQVLDEPERTARARLFSTTVRNCPASKSASSRSKLNAWPSEVALA